MTRSQLATLLGLTLDGTAAYLRGTYVGALVPVKAAYAAANGWPVWPVVDGDGIGDLAYTLWPHSEQVARQGK